MKPCFSKSSDLSELKEAVNWLKETVSTAYDASNDAEFAVESIKNILDGKDSESSPYIESCGYCTSGCDGKHSHSDNDGCGKTKCQHILAHDYDEEYDVDDDEWPLDLFLDDEDEEEDVPYFGVGETCEYQSCMGDHLIDMLHLMVCDDEEITDTFDHLMDLACDLPKNIDKIRGAMIGFIYAHRNTRSDLRKMAVNLFVSALDGAGVGRFVTEFAEDGSNPHGFFVKLMEAERCG